MTHQPCEQRQADQREPETDEGYPHRVTEAIPVGYRKRDRFRRDDPGQMDGPQERRDHEAVHQHVIADEAQDRDAHGPLEASGAQPQQAVQEEAGEDQQLEETQQKKRKEHRSTIRIAEVLWNDVDAWSRAAPRVYSGDRLLERES